jgi:hypothetical protein
MHVLERPSSSVKLFTTFCSGHHKNDRELKTYYALLKFI